LLLAARLFNETDTKLVFGDQAGIEQLLPDRFRITVVGGQQRGDRIHRCAAPGPEALPEDSEPRMCACSGGVRKKSGVGRDSRYPA